MRQVFLDRYLSRDPIVRLGLQLLASSVRRARRARYTLARLMAALNVDVQLVDERPADFIEIPPHMRHLAEAVWLRAVRQDVDGRPPPT
jgi:hypothetical protein